MRSLLKAEKLHKIQDAGMVGGGFGMHQGR